MTHFVRKRTKIDLLTYISCKDLSFCVKENLDKNQVFLTVSKSRRLLRGWVSNFRGHRPQEVASTVLELASCVNKQKL